MIEIFSSLMMIVGGAALFRLRGSSKWYEWTGRGATSIRLIWSAYLGLVAYLVASSVWWAPLALVPAFWLGTILPWWGSLDMGRNEGSFLQDFALHTLRGFLWVLPAASVLWFIVSWNVMWLLAAGGLCGVIYAISGKINEARATENAEWVFGGTITASLILALT